MRELFKHMSDLEDAFWDLTEAIEDANKALKDFEIGPVDEHGCDCGLIHVTDDEIIEPYGGALYLWQYAEKVTKEGYFYMAANDCVFDLNDIGHDYQEDFYKYAVWEKGKGWNRYFHYQGTTYP